MTKSLFKTFLQEEQGQDLVEYALLLAFVALAATTVLGTLGTNIKGLFSNISTKISTATPAN